MIFSALCLQSGRSSGLDSSLICKQAEVMTWPDQVCDIAATCLDMLVSST